MSMASLCIQFMAVLSGCLSQSKYVVCDIYIHICVIPLRLSECAILSQLYLFICISLSTDRKFNQLAMFFLFMQCLYITLLRPHQIDFLVFTTAPVFFMLMFRFKAQSASSKASTTKNNSGLHLLQNHQGLVCALRVDRCSTMCAKYNYDVACN